MILSAIAAVALVPQARSVELFRGAVVTGSGPEFTYWDATDATLDSTQPEASLGGQGLLQGGLKKTIVVRFGDLQRVVPSGWKVSGATLEMVVNSGRSLALAGVTRVRTAWGEGPLNTFRRVIASKDAPVATARGSACWKFARFGAAESAWNGASGGEAIPYDASKSTPEKLVVDGLGPAVQYAVDHACENNGWALTFSDSVDLLSAQANEQRPKLRLTLEPAPTAIGPDLSVVSIQTRGVGLLATVRNIGDGPAPAFKGAWVRDGAEPEVVTGPALAAGETTTFNLASQPAADKSDHRLRFVDFRLANGTDANPRNDQLRYFSGGKEIPVATTGRIEATNGRGTHAAEDWVQSQATLFNEVYLALSRYSFAPDGAHERVNLIPGSAEGGATLPPHPVADGADPAFLKTIGLALGLKDAAVGVPGHPGGDAFAGVMGGGDTRNDTAISPRTALPNLPRYPLDEFSGMLSMTDVATINNGLDGVAGPKRRPVAIVFAKDLNGESLVKTTLDLFRPSDLSTPIRTVQVDRTGSFLLSNELDGGDVLVRGKAFGSEAWTWLKSWQLSDAVSRGGVGAAILELRFNLPSSPLDAGQDLARDRSVLASTSIPSDQLAKLTTGDGATSVALGEKADDWFEIDLGKDRTLGEITLATSGAEFWRRFDVRVYGTGDKPEDALTWMTVADSRWLFQAVGDGARVAMRGPIVRVRYLRFVNRSGGPGALASVKVTPIVPVGGTS